MGFVSTIAQAWTVQRALRDQSRYARAVKNPRETQRAWLLDQLRREQDTAFGREHRFADIRTVADFRRNVPLGSYETHEPYIERVKQGDTEALFHNQRVRMFALTSGTTSARKFIPVTDRVLDSYRRVWTVWGLLAYAPRPALFRHARLTLVSDWDEFRTDAGIPCGSISGFTAQLQNWVVRQGYVLPPESGKLKSTEAKHYLAWRLGVTRAIGSWITPNPSTLLQLARFGEQHAEALLRDVRDGTLNIEFDWPVPLVHSLKRQIKPQPQRARQLEQIINRTGSLRPKDVWPELKLLGCWTGGSMAAYLRSFPEYFGDAAVRDLGLIASEGRMTFPIEDHTASGVLEIVSGFFEFIPVDEIDSPQPTVLEADELVEGGEYFILLTTASGLYRYNIWDVVRCTGWYERTPLLEFLHKGNGISNITGEKLTEHQVASAVAATLDRLDVQIGTFSLAPCWDDRQPFYGLFVEETHVPSPPSAAERARVRGRESDSAPLTLTLSPHQNVGRGDRNDDSSVTDLAAAIDAELQRANIEYAAKRASGRLGPVQLQFLPEGEWRRWDQARLDRSGGSAEQYKHPCLIPNLEFRETVVREVVET